MLQMQPERHDGDGAAIGVVGRVPGVLVVEGEDDNRVDRYRVVGLGDRFGPVVEPSVTDDEARAAARQKLR